MIQRVTILGAEMLFAEMDSRDSSWGFPKVHQFRVPDVGDLIDIPYGEGDDTWEARVRVLHSDGDEVHFGDDVDSDGEASGHLRMSYTGDGLYLFFRGSERDGYSCVFISDDACGGCGRSHARWRVQRGRPSEELEESEEPDKSRDFTGDQLLARLPNEDQPDSPYELGQVWNASQLHMIDGEFQISVTRYVTMTMGNMIGVDSFEVASGRGDTLREACKEALAQLGDLLDSSSAVVDCSLLAICPASSLASNDTVSDTKDLGSDIALNADGNKPLCPHCFREACPWLMAYKHCLMGSSAYPNPGEPVPRECPHAGLSMSPGARRFLRKRLGLDDVRTVSDTKDSDSDSDSDIALELKQLLAGDGTVSAPLVSKGVGEPEWWHVAGVGKVARVGDTWESSAWANARMQIDDQTRTGLVRQLAIWASGGRGKMSAYVLEIHSFTHWRLMGVDRAGGYGTLKRKDGSLCVFEHSGIRVHPGSLDSSLVSILTYIGLDHAICRSLGWEFELGTLATLESPMPGLWVIRRGKKYVAFGATREAVRASNVPFSEHIPGLEGLLAQDTISLLQLLWVIYRDVCRG